MKEINPPYRPEIGGPPCKRNRHECFGRYCRRHRLETQLEHYIQGSYPKPMPTVDEMQVMSVYSWHDHFTLELIDPERALLIEESEGMRKGDRSDEAD